MLDPFTRSYPTYFDFSVANVTIRGIFLLHSLNTRRSPRPHDRNRPTRLGQAVELQSGYVEPRPGPRHPSEVRVVRASDVGADGSIDWAHLGSCPASSKAARAALHHGDLLVTTRTTAPRTIAIDHPPPAVVAGAQFAILRPDPEQVDPSWLAWWMNSDRASHRLRLAFKGSTMPFLSLAALAEFPIEIPPIATQRTIARVHALRQRCTTLSERLDRCLGRLLEARNLNPLSPASSR